ncbi:hypothetical protein ACIPY6_07560 [Streptomyces sp. NPDC090054]|uniref:hypothetical protein n=1 Tax=Streptomyces sp. NPDC090054 TaxID=3365933 RepID=UPI00380739AF
MERFNLTAVPGSPCLASHHTARSPRRSRGLRIGHAYLVVQAATVLTRTGRTVEAHRRAGSPAAALDDLLECGRRQSDRQVIGPIVTTPWRSATACCRLLLGRPGEAVPLDAEELEAARRWRAPRCVGRPLRALGTATGVRSA